MTIAFKPIATKEARERTTRHTGGNSVVAFTACKRAFFASLIVCALLPAELLAVGPRNIRFRHVSLPETSHGAIHAIVQDHHGLMWFGTRNGLHRYDGYETTSFVHDPSDPTSLSSSTVRAVYEDSEHRLWVGTDSGLDRFDPRTESFSHFTHDPSNPKSLSHNSVRILYEDSSKTLWVGTNGGGLNRLMADGTFERIIHNPANPKSLSSDRIRAIVEGRDGTLWIGTDGGGLERTDSEGRRFDHYRHEPEDATSLSSNRVQSLYEDDKGVLYVGTHESGLNRLDRASGTFARFRHDPDVPESLTDDSVVAIRQDSRGTLWIATDGGLCEWQRHEDRCRSYLHDASDSVSLSDNRVTALMEDRGSVLWVGTARGLDSWNLAAGSFALYRHDTGGPNEPSGNIVFSFAEDKDDGIWIATYDGGLSRLDRRTELFTHHRAARGNPSGHADDRITSLLVDSESSLWVGTFQDGLGRYDPKTGSFERYRHDPNDENTLSWNGVTRIFEDSRGDLWVGTHRGGLNKLQRKDGTFIRYTTENTNLSDNRISAIIEGEDGVLWIATDGGGLNRFDPTDASFSHFRHDSKDPTSLASDNVRVLYRDRKSRLWIGTRDGGLNRWDAHTRRAHRGEFRRYTTKDGLPSSVINGILEDETGLLWISTNRGISKFDPERETFKNYGEADGLQGDEFQHGAAYRARDGEMFFGGPHGFNRFWPDEIKDNQQAPPVVLRAFLKFNESVDLGQPITEVREIELTHKDYVVAFEFAALDYTDPEKNRYMYQLEGFDEDWIEAGDLRRATYTNLEPREYTFRVKAANSDGVWNDAGLAIQVNVIPPPWRTWWAYMIYGLSTVALVYAYTRVQARKLERKAEYNRELELQVAARTEELADRNRELEEASLTDSLTGSWNRRYLLQQIPTEIAEIDRQLKLEQDGEEDPAKGQSLLFLMFDLDGFKELNDSHGHAAGDRVLVQVRKMFLDVCRQSDIIVRWGGDEFLLVGKNADPVSAENLAERIRAAIEGMPFDIGLAQKVHLSCSIGFAFYPFDRQTPKMFSWEQIVGIADRALYVTKQSGKNGWAGLLAAETLESPRLLERIHDELEELVAEGVIALRDSRQRRPTLVQSLPKTKAGGK